MVTRTASLEPYTIPEADADLWHVGVRLETRRSNPSRPVVGKRRRSPKVLPLVPVMTSAEKRAVWKAARLRRTKWLDALVKGVQSEWKGPLSSLHSHGPWTVFFCVTAKESVRIDVSGESVWVHGGRGPSLYDGLHSLRVAREFALDEPHDEVVTYIIDQMWSLVPAPPCTLSGVG